MIRQQMKREIEDLYIEIDSDIIKEANELYLEVIQKDISDDDKEYIESMNQYINSYSRYREKIIKNYLDDLRKLLGE
jgi:hypothetical protein